MSHTPAWITRLRTEWNLPADVDDASAAWLAADDLADRGTERLAEFLDVYQTIEKHRSTSTGVGRAFGLLKGLGVKFPRASL